MNIHLFCLSLLAFFLICFDTTAAVDILDSSRLNVLSENAADFITPPTIATGKICPIEWRQSEATPTEFQLEWAQPQQADVLVVHWSAKPADFQIVFYGPTDTTIVWQEKNNQVRGPKIDLIFLPLHHFARITFVVHKPVIDDIHGRGVQDPQLCAISHLELFQKEALPDWLVSFLDTPVPRLSPIPQLKSAQIDSQHTNLLTRPFPEWVPIPLAKYQQQETGKITNEKASQRRKLLTELARAWAETRDIRYAQRGCELLNLVYGHYDTYQGFRFRDYDWKAVTFQEPAYMMRNINTAYDLLADSPAMTLENKLRFVYFSIDNAEFQRIAIEKLFYGKENWAANSIGEIVNTAWYLSSAPQASSWIQAADAKVGECYDFFMADGTWWECSPAHAGYTLRGLCKYGVGKHLLGEPIWTHKFHGKCLVDLIEALLLKMTPFGEFPTINDTNTHHQHLLTDFPEYFQALTLIGRGDLLTMAQADENPPFIPGNPSTPLNKSNPVINSLLFPDGGVGIFRDGWKPDDSYLLVDFGPHGGGHGHYDKLSFLMAAQGHHWIPDGGCSPHYCIFPEQESWHRQTISHNTILVNGQSQAEATGKCMMWFTSEKLDAITVSVDSCYPGVHHYRTIIHPRNGYFFIYDRVISEHEAQLEWLLHVNGKLDGQQAGELIFNHESKRLQVLYSPALAALPEIKQGLVGGFDRHLWDGIGYPEKGQPGWRYIPYFSLNQAVPSSTTVTYAAVLCPFTADFEKLTLETRKNGEQMIVTIRGEMGIDEIILPAQICPKGDGGIQFRHKKAETEWVRIIN